jgi:hypothetical protein
MILHPTTMSVESCCWQQEAKDHHNTAVSTVEWRSVLRQDDQHVRSNRCIYSSISRQTHKRYSPVGFQTAPSYGTKRKSTAWRWPLKFTSCQTKNSTQQFDNCHVTLIHCSLIWYLHLDKSVVDHAHEMYQYSLKVAPLRAAKCTSVAVWTKRC